MHGDFGTMFFDMQKLNIDEIKYTTRHV